MSSQAPQAEQVPCSDAATLSGWLERMVAALRFKEVVVAIVALVMHLRARNTELMRQMAQRRRKRPRSETFERVAAQLVLSFPACAPTTPSAPGPAPEGGEAKAAPKEKKSRKGVHPGRAKLPEHLQRIPIDNPVPEAMRVCPQCGAQMATVGHETCEVLEVRPAQFVVLQRRDERVACPHDDTIVSAPTPPQIVERGKLGPTLIIEATADKYLEHQPIERQARRFARSGVPIAPQTLGRSVAAHLDLLQPVADCIHSLTRVDPLLSVDATGIPVLDGDEPEGIRTGTMWCWVGQARWVSFVYSPVGDSDSVRAFLGDPCGRIVQCDGTSITTFIEKNGGKRPGCWAHARRGLAEAARSGEVVALEGLRIIRRLFAVERVCVIRGSDHRERLSLRRTWSRPAVDELRAWVDEQRATIPPKSTYGRALGYLHRQWARLCLFLEDGRIEATNNHVERELRALVLGRKNWLFVAEDVGGQRAAAIYTILGTCLVQRVNPRAYLHLVTRLLIEGWPQAKLRDLLPDRLARAHPELRLPDVPRKAPSRASLRLPSWPPPLELPPICGA